MYTLVVIRHGESEWNQKNLFCGWTDVELTENGYGEARKAGQLLKQEGYTFDLCYTSVLKRAIHTAYTVLDEMDLTWIPVIKDYHLNERHYGALQGLNKSETTANFLAPYREAAAAGTALPLTECLKDTVARTAPYFDEVIRPQIAAGRKVLIAAHGNSIRALIKHLEGTSDEAIAGINVPTGIPRVYHLNEDFTVHDVGYLGDQEAIIRAKIEAVKQQSAAKK